MHNQLIIGVLLLSLVKFAVANDLADSQQETIFEDGNNHQTDQQQLKFHQSAIEKMLADVERRYGETAAQLYSLHVKIKQKQRHLEEIHQNIQAHEKRLEKERAELAAQVKAAYKMGKQEQLRLMFNQQDPGLSARMLMYYQHINKARLEKIADIEKSVAELERLNQQDQDETANLEQSLQEKQAEQTALNMARKQRNEVLARIANETSPQEQLNYLLESEADLQAIFTGLPDPNAIKDNDVAPDIGNGQKQQDGNDKPDAAFTLLKGQLPWPVKGRIAQKFGSPRSETVWDGILIDSPEGMEIHAVAAGRVVFAEWLKSYGYLIIIEHDKDFMSLYAFNQSLLKNKNDTVKAGDVIATVGQSGGRDQPGLYFGIRKQGIAIDPLQWCRK